MKSPKEPNKAECFVVVCVSFGQGPPNGRVAYISGLFARSDAVINNNNNNSYNNGESTNPDKGERHRHEGGQKISQHTFERFPISYQAR